MNIKSLKINDNNFNPINTTIGGIIQTLLPVLDTRFHLADGTWLSGEIFNYVKRCEELYPNIFTCTDEEFETALNTYNQCGKFVLDNENRRTRLPKLDGFIEGTSNVESATSLKQCGLPNIEGVIHFGYGDMGSDPFMFSGAFYGSDACKRFGRNADNNPGFRDVHLDASRSSKVYGRSQKVQPQSILVLTYIRVQ